MGTEFDISRIRPMASSQKIELFPEEMVDSAAISQSGLFPLLIIKLCEVIDLVAASILQVARNMFLDFTRRRGCRQGQATNVLAETFIHYLEAALE